MPDSALGILAQRVARLEQRVDDLMTRVVEKFTEVAEDFRVFGPMLQDHASFRSDLQHALADFNRSRQELHEAVREVRREVAALEVKLDVEADERRAGQEERRKELHDAIAERRKENSQNKAMIRVAAIGLIGAFVTSAGALLTAILSGGP